MRYLYLGLDSLINLIIFSQINEPTVSLGCYRANITTIYSLFPKEISINGNLRNDCPITLWLYYYNLRYLLTGYGSA